VLVAHAAGDFAAALDGLSDSTVLNLFKRSVQAAYTGVFFSGGSAATNWSNDPWIQGAYSYSAFNGGSPDDRSTLSARIALGEPVKQLYFAGEATNVDYYGTLQAAYFEGVRAAKAILA
jgi:monoamine oxidase